MISSDTSNAREKVREYRAAYRAAHRAKEREQNAAYYAAHREKRREQMAAYCAANREELRAYSAAYDATHREEKRAYCATNAVHLREQVRQWRKDNPGAVRAQCAKRRAMQLTQRCACCTDAEIQKIYDIAALCGAGAHVDHKIQLALGGPHCAKNLEALTAEAHIEKTKLDAAARADVRRRSRLLHSWSRFAAAA